MLPRTPRHAHLVTWACLGLAACTGKPVHSGDDAGFPAFQDAKGTPPDALADSADVKKDAAVQDSGVSDSVPSDAVADVPSADAPCPLDTLRCGSAGREACTDQGWSASPCGEDLPVCVEGNCLACLPGKVWCADPAPGSSTSLEVIHCTSAGASEVMETCAGGSSCVDGACANCVPGTSRCHGGQREVCSTDAKAWTADPCPASKPTCDEGTCYFCAPSKSYCEPAQDASPTVVLLCDSKGYDAIDATPCKSGEFCHVGACVTCVPDATKCAGANGLATCAADGQGWSTLPCPGGQPACVAGQCLACVPKAAFCGPPAADGTASAKILQCNGDGSQASLASTCTGGLVCVNGACALCAPGAKSCLGQSILVCNGDGKGLDQGENCAAKNLGCVKGACQCAAGLPLCTAAASGLLPSTQTAQCDATGKAAVVKATCGPTEVCDAGACIACQPGTTLCQSGKAIVCKGDASGFQVVQDCAAAGLTCTGGQCKDLCDPKFANPTNLGCDFWAVDLDNAGASGGSGIEPQNAQFGVLLVNSGATPAVVTVTLGPDKLAPGAKTTTLQVAAGAMATVNLPNPGWSVPAQNQDGTTVAVPAYRIESDKPLAVFQHNPLDSAAVSSDASMLLPVNALGSEYRVLGRPQSFAQLRGFLTVVATRTGMTQVTVVTTAPTLAGGKIAALKSGDTLQVELAQGQVLNLETDAVGGDLSGSKVTADQAVAVFSGSEAANAPATTTCVLLASGAAGTCKGTGKLCFADADCPQACCADHLEEQLLPVTTWGTVHVATHLQPRDPASQEQDVWRILAAQDGTTVVTVPPQAKVPMLNAGQWFEFESKADFVVQANKPVALAQFMASSQMTQVGLGDQGDPAMLLAVPVSRLASQHTFAAPSTYPNQFINLAVPIGTSVVLDGNALGAGTEIPGQPWRVLRQAIGPGLHTVKATRPMVLSVYGWKKGASYGHPGGLGEP